MVPDKLKLNSLTGLRFYLAIFVFFYHGMTQAHLDLGTNRLPLTVFEFLRYSFDGGLAVGIFFFLSGFVLWYNYAGRQWTYGRFMANRIARLYPIYLLGIAIILLRWNNLLHEFSVSSLEAFRRLALSLFMLQSWTTDWRSTQMFNGPGWTLSAEMFFYVTFPFLFWIHSRSTRCFIAVCGVVSLFSATCPFLGVNDWTPVCARQWGLFTLGTLFCWAWVRGMKFTLPPLLVIAVLFFGYQFTRLAAPSLVIPFLAVLIVGALATADVNSKSPRCFAGKWPVLGGEISYAIYILHMPIQTIVYSLFFRSGVFLLKADNIYLKLGYLSICLAATLVSSYLAWRFIEVPGRRMIIRWLSKSPA